MAAPPAAEGTISVIPPTPLHLQGLWRIGRPAGFSGRASGLSHHLVHLVERGGYALTLAGRPWAVEAPALIWYHGPEAVGWQGDGRAVRFLSCAFACPGLAPPPASARLVAAPPAAIAATRALEAAGRAAGDLRGALALQAAACHWLDALLDAFALGGDGGLWEHAERLALAARDRPTVADLAGRLAVSVSTLERLCRARHGCPPGVRLRRLRLAHARALAAHGGLGRAAVARMVGYADRRSLRRALQPPG